MRITRCQLVSARLRVAFATLGSHQHELRIDSALISDKGFLWQFRLA